MRMNPSYFYDCFVLPNYHDFCEDESNVRKGFNASVSASHMTDNYYYYNKVNCPSKISIFSEIRKFKGHLSSKTPYFNDIQSVANVYKHLYNRSTKPFVTIESGGVVTSILIKGDNIVEISGCEINDMGTDVVVYKRKDSTKVRLKKALDHVIDMWNNILRNE